MIKVVVNIRESFMNVNLCSLKSSLGVKRKISAVLKHLVQKINQIPFVKPLKNSIYYLVTFFLKKYIVIPIESFDAFMNNFLVFDEF